MVNEANISQSSQSIALHLIVEEQVLLSKTGRPEDCEDLIHVSDHFIAVIDGATSKTARRWSRETGGKTAAHIISQAFSQIPREATACEATDLMTSMIYDVYKRFDVVETVEADAVQRMTASFAAVSLWRREVWLIGDCQFLLGHKRVSNEKVVDRISSDARALFLEAEILRGATIEQLCQNDSGREFIYPLLERQSEFQNNSYVKEYWYPVVDGFPIPTDGIIVQRIPTNIESIVLATDGYPILRNSLKESEAALQKILLNDPLMFREHKTTKGMLNGHVSFDDRAFIKIGLKRAPKSEIPRAIST